MEAVIKILGITLPFLLELFKSYAVPALKRRMYQTLDRRADALIEDLAQNASKIKNEQDETKKSAYIEGTKLGLDTIKALGEKLIKASEVISEAL